MSRTAKQIAQEVGAEDGANALSAIGMVDSLNNVPGHVIDHLIRKRMSNTRTERSARRETMVQKLMQTAF